jgi:nicotinamide phosphoribosyltransferase
MNDQFNLMYAADFYKVSHKAQYPENITNVHSVLVARGAKYNNMISTEEFMWFGVDIFIHKLHKFENWFFELSTAEVKEVIAEYKEFLETRLSSDHDVSHWLDLYRLQYLPIVIHALPQRVPQKFQVPLLTVENIEDGYGWLTTFIETTMLSNVWGVTTAANRAWHIRKAIESFMPHGRRSSYVSRMWSPITVQRL